MRKEVGKLLNRCFVKGFRFKKWVTNPMLVKRNNEKSRMCVYFRDLNKTCPKDAYLFHRIDQLVDATSEHQMLSFIDAYPVYNLIMMHSNGEFHTTFYANNDILCYKSCSLC